MRTRTLIATSVVAVAALSLIAASLGGASSTSTTTAHGGLLAYSQCMRAHGLPNFPEPTPSEGIPKDKLIPLVGSPRFAVASNTCQSLMPAKGLGPQQSVAQTQTRVAATHAFAMCMRDHGFQTFPDPTGEGELTPQTVTAAGIDLHEPALLQAGLICAPVTHGVITRAAVQRAVNGG